MSLYAPVEVLIYRDRNDRWRGRIRFGDETIHVRSDSLSEIFAAVRRVAMRRIG